MRGIQNGEDGDEDLSEELKHLIDRDVDSVSFPDRIYALGGGGRKMLLEIFGQDWVAIEAMRGRNQDINLVFIDTATETTENHSDQVDHLTTHLDYLEQTFQEETPADTPVGGINIREQLITEDLQIRTRASLTGQSTIDAIKSHTDAESWWLRREHLDATDGSSDFYSVSKGAIKRRALGKALHYKALAEGGRKYKDSLKTTAEESEIAIFTGLGGGTGSGTFIDTAREIRDRNPEASINLFATIPSSNQRNETRANAFAALSELEYLQLNGKTPFNDIFLFPLEPTGLQSEATELPELTEFDRAATYAVLGVYNSDDRDFALSNTLSYSPFTIAVPQVLRYSRDEIKRKKDEIQAILEFKRELLNLEYFYFEEISEYLDQHYPATTKASGSDLSEDAREYLITRLQEFEQLITSDLLEKLDIEITEFSDTFLNDIYGEELDPKNATLDEVFRRRTLDDVISGLEFIIERRDISGGRVDNYAEFDDPLMRDVVHTELHRISELFDLLCRLRGAEMETMDSSSAEVATNADTKLIETFLVPTLSRTDEKDRWETLTTVHENTENDLAEAENQLEEAEDQKTSEQERYETETQQWFDQLWPDIEPLAEDFITLSEANIDDAVRNLIQELNQYANSIAVDDPDMVSDADVQTALTELESEVGITLNNDGHSVDFESFKLDIDESLQTVRRARNEWDTLENNSNEGGLLSGLLGSDDQGPLETERYQAAKRQIDDIGVFTIPRPPNTESALERTDFFVEINDNVNENLKQQVSAARSDIKSTLIERYTEGINEIGTSSPSAESSSESVIGSASKSDTGQLQTTITRTINQRSSEQLLSEIRSELRKDIQSQIGTDLEQYESEIERWRNKLSSLKRRNERLNSAKDLYDTITKRTDQPIRELYEEYENEFTGDVFNVPHQRATRHAIENLYTQQVTPADLSSAIKRPSLAETDLLESPSGGTVSQERQDIRKSIGRIVSNRVLENQYNGLERLRLKTSDRETFADTGIYVSFASEAIRDDREIDNKLNPTDFEGAEKSLKNNFGLNDDANQYDQWFIENSDPWEIGMCVYIQGIPFLDNLRDVIETTNGYWSRYQSLTKQRNEAKTIERHAYGLEKGFYHVRSELVDINGNPEFFLEHSSDIVRDRLAELHSRTEIDAGVETEGYKEHSQKKSDEFDH